MADETNIRKAEFNPKVCTYWLVSGVVTLTVTVVGIPFIPFWLIFGLLLTKYYLTSMECVLTDKSLNVKKGNFTRIEKTVPLEKITDIGMVQGPIMRMFGLHQLSVETAGQSGAGSLVSLTGIVDAKGFREAVLKQRDTMSITVPQPGITTESTFQSNDNALLEEIRDSLHRIEAVIEKASSPKE